ncbi:hypothetical protein FP828_03605 [bacterium]|nr:hypothetical protein [Candidatus Omnitrophota bacterium]MBA3065559.1 hypothetical protein [bacterium]
MPNRNIQQSPWNQNVQAVSQFLETLNNLKKQQYEGELMKQYASQVSQETDKKKLPEIMKLVEGGNLTGALEMALPSMEAPAIMQQRQAPQTGGFLSRLGNTLNPVGQYRGTGLTPTEATITDARAGQTSKALTLIRNMQALLESQTPKAETEAARKRRMAVQDIATSLQRGWWKNKKGETLDVTSSDPNMVISDMARDYGISESDPSVVAIKKQIKNIKPAQARKGKWNPFVEKAATPYGIELNKSQKTTYKSANEIKKAFAENKITAVEAKQQLLKFGFK